MFSALCISGFFHFLQTAVFAVGYISGTSLFPEPLSSEEERIYLEKLSTGDEDARNILIESKNFLEIFLYFSLLLHLFS